MMHKMPKEWKRNFPLNPPVSGIRQPVTSPVFEVRQFRKSNQKKIDTLEPGTLIRFTLQDVNGPRIDNGLPLYEISFVIERFNDGDWVECSQTLYREPLYQDDIAEHILIVPDEDGDDPTIFAAFDAPDRPLVVLVPHETQ